MCTSLKEVRENIRAIPGFSARLGRVRAYLEKAETAATSDEKRECVKRAIEDLSAIICYYENRSDEMSDSEEDRLANLCLWRGSLWLLLGKEAQNERQKGGEESGGSGSGGSGEGAASGEGGVG